MEKIKSPLSRKATLVAVAISQWTGRKLDKRITDEVNSSHGAAADAGRYNKLLLEKKRLAKINSVVSQARELHYRLTKPWADQGGLRILPNKLHKQFTDEFRKLKRDFEDAVDEFCADYPEAIEERKRALNGLFNEADYPSPKDIRSKFSLDTTTSSVPDKDDFRSEGLDEATIEDIKRELETSSAKILDAAMLDSFEQMKKVVGHMAEKLKAYKTDGGGFFTDSLVGNVRELVELLPSFNLTDDPAFDALTAKIARELCAEEPKTLRDNDELRADVAKSADDILKEIDGLLG